METKTSIFNANFYDLNCRIDSPRSLSILKEYKLKPSKLIFLDFHTFIKVNPQLKDKSKQIQLETFNLHEETRLANIAEITKKYKSRLKSRDMQTSPIFKADSPLKLAKTAKSQEKTIKKIENLSKGTKAKQIWENKAQELNQEMSKITNLPLKSEEIAALTAKKNKELQSMLKELTVIRKSELDQNKEESRKILDKQLVRKSFRQQQNRILLQEKEADANHKKNEQIQDKSAVYRKFKKELELNEIEVQP